jgi:hypothetical protein
MGQKWLPPSWIPNIEGTRVECLLVNGEHRVDVVKKDKDGLHSLSATPIAEVSGWRAFNPWVRPKGCECDESQPAVRKCTTEWLRCAARIRFVQGQTGSR